MIVVDDGSTDDSANAIQRKLRCCPIPYRLVTHANHGAHAALNEAVALASGAFVNPLNSDDLFEPTRIADMVQHIARRNFEWGFAKCVAVDGASNVIAPAGNGLAAQFADYYASVLDRPPANRFAPSRAATGWSCLANGLSVGQGAALAPEILVRLEADLDSEDERTTHRIDDRRRHGLNVVGFFRGDFGLAEGARGLARSCCSTGVPATFHDADVMLESRQSSRAMDAHLTDDMRHRDTLFYLNPDSLQPLWRRFADRGEVRGRRVIGYWFWEIDAFPRKWRPALDLVDEIWVATDFVGNIIRRVTNKPVIKIPHALKLSLGRAYARAEFCLPERRFLSLFTFDFNSFSERKNPLAATEAFARAFPAGDERAGLVIKCAQGYRFPEQFGMLHGWPPGTRASSSSTGCYRAGMSPACKAFATPTSRCIGRKVSDWAWPNAWPRASRSSRRPTRGTSS